ncbi:hypothetical protein, partial [Bradyrhizobium sp. CER78]|uniref:hypothetical protein n=1 Tax=Bradyrhizobium sp. CER78 TaxID=3039162 RepID=UPI00244732B4
MNVGVMMPPEIFLGGRPAGEGSQSRGAGEVNCMGTASRHVASGVIARLDRAIQYAAAYRPKYGRLWINGS